MVTISDLSRHLGLSKTQISRALSGYSDVSEKTRQRVVEGAREIGYRPNALAQKLRTGRSGIVGLVMQEDSAQQEANILNEMLIGLAVEFWRRDTLVVLNVMPQGGSTIEAYRRLTDDGRLDGFVVLNPGVDWEGIEYLRSLNVPLVVHGRHKTEADYPFVDIDNCAAGEMMAAHLVAHGHRDIAFVEGPEGMFFADERFRGVQKALAAAGASIRPERIARGVMTEQLGEAAIAQFMQDPNDRPSAIIVGNLVVATGLVRALEGLGLVVPDDVSVVAHDDELSRYPAASFNPRLTGTRSPFASAYSLLAQYLNEAIGGMDSAQLQNVADPSLVEGASVKRINR